VESANDQPAPIASTRSEAGGESCIEAGSLELCFKAAIFDMDGVVTNTAAAHSNAWKETFDGFLRLRATARHEPFAEFTREGDYRAYVDGRPRYNGVEAFLKSRGIELPRGTPDDAPGRETICGLGNQKNVIFNQIIEREGIRTFDSTVSLVSEMIRRGIKVGLATSSYNSEEVLGRTNTAHLFATVVDGVESAKRGLKGKPDPDIFAAAAGDLGVPIARAIVIEDAVTGVQAGVKGGFALVIGIARDGNVLELQKNGADLVVRDLAETSIEQINRLVQDKRARTG
jgi:beta-phosphoglucomutase-like phosphatase (HAD superfamily)